MTLAVAANTCTVERFVLCKTFSPSNFSVLP